MEHVIKSGISSGWKGLVFGLALFIMSAFPTSAQAQCPTSLPPCEFEICEWRECFEMVPGTDIDKYNYCLNSIYNADPLTAAEAAGMNLLLAPDEAKTDCTRASNEIPGLSPENNLDGGTGEFIVTFDEHYVDGNRVRLRTAIGGAPNSVTMECQYDSVSGSYSWVEIASSGNCYAGTRLNVCGEAPAPPGTVYDANEDDESGDCQTLSARSGGHTACNSGQDSSHNDEIRIPDAFDDMFEIAPGAEGFIHMPNCTTPPSLSHPKLVQNPLNKPLMVPTKCGDFENFVNNGPVGSFIDNGCPGMTLALCPVSLEPSPPLLSDASCMLGPADTSNGGGPYPTIADAESAGLCASADPDSPNNIEVSTGPSISGNTIVWECRSTGSGETVSGSTSMIADGVCGPATASSYDPIVPVSSIPDKCAAGNPTDYGINDASVSPAYTFSWICESTAGGSDSPRCYADMNVDATCGIAGTSGNSYFDIPTLTADGLCADGFDLAAGGVSDTGTQFEWTCEGSGTGTDANCSAPKATCTTPSWVEVEAGRDNSCGLTTTGQILCWGDDSRGMVSDAPTANNFATIDTNFHNGCALTTTGDVVCWGDNEDGEFGDEPVTSGPGFTSLGTGSSNVCAIDSGGQVRCGGDSEYNIDINEPSGTYDEVDTGSNRLACARDGSGVDCWGTNAGASGPSSPVSDAPNVGIAGPIAVGSHQACAIRTSGGITCWGDDVLGVGVVYGYPTTGSFWDLAISARVGCALDGSNNIQCWGEPSNAVLSSIPSGTYTDLGVGLWHACAVSTSGTMECWGDDPFGGVSNIPACLPAPTAPGCSSRLLNWGSSPTCEAVIPYGYDGNIDTATDGVDLQDNPGTEGSANFQCDGSTGNWILQPGSTCITSLNARCGFADRSGNDYADAAAVWAAGACDRGSVPGGVGGIDDSDASIITWTCEGAGSGVDRSCSAPKSAAPPPPPPTCTPDGTIAGLVDSDTYTGPDVLHTVVANDHLFVLSVSGSNVFDISNPANPVQVNGSVFGDAYNDGAGNDGGYILPDNGNDLNGYAVRSDGNFAIVPTSIAAGTDTRVHAIDFSDKSAGEIIGTLDVDGLTVGDGQNDAIIVNSNIAVLQGVGNILVIDISNPASMSVLSSPSHGVFVQNDMAYHDDHVFAVTTGTTSNNSLVVTDISDPNNPIIRRGWTGGGALAPAYDITSAVPQPNALSMQDIELSEDGDHLFVYSDDNHYLYAIDVSNPGSPNVVGWVATGLTSGRALHLVGDVLFITRGSDIASIDISDPTSMSVIDTFSGLPINGNYSMTTHEGYLYIPNFFDNTLRTYELGCL